MPEPQGPCEPGDVDGKSPSADEPRAETASAERPACADSGDGSVDLFREEAAPEGGQGFAVPLDGAALEAKRPEETESAGGGGWGELPPEPTEPELVALRSLLLQREISLLDKLKRRLDDPGAHARDVSGVIAEALLLRAGKDDKLAHSLEPVVENLFKKALRKSPLDFANALVPVMGPAIRRSIAETFRSMLEGLNKSVEVSLSWKGLRWRLEAWRSGKPFSEIVLLNTLVYRVEQIFLIHRGSGLVLVHEADEGVEYQDADMVSAMLTAIQDFVHDSFARGSEGELESVSLGEHVILMEQKRQILLACVVRGQPPADFREKMRTSLDLIELEFYEELENYSGDSAPFALARRHFSDLMLSRFVDEDKPLALWTKALPVALLLCLAGGLFFWQYRAREHAEQLAQERNAFYEYMNAATEALRREPGFTLFSFDRAETAPWTLYCLRDELARPAGEVLREAGAAEGDFLVNCTPYISLDKEIVRQRVAAAIQPPEGVSMALGEDGVLRLSGKAPMGWALAARQKALTLPGVKEADIGGVSDPRTARIRELIAHVESLSIRFGLDKSTPTAEDAPRLAQAVDALVEMEKLAAEMGMAVTVTIFGHTDSLGSPIRNYELSQARANTLAALLYVKGSGITVASYGMGADFADKSAVGKSGVPDDRRIELRVHLTRAVGGEDFSP